MEKLEKQPDVNIVETGSEQTEADETIVPPKRNLTGKSARAVLNTDDWWIWEIVGVIFSAAAIAAIVALLQQYNGKRQPNWGIHMRQRQVGKHTIPEHTISLSLNSVISWISTVGKICVLIPVTRGLGQLKWVWFSEQERELTDFENFDNATRGLTGSAFLVWKLKGRHFAVFGAVAVILALGFDPFIQNLVTYGTDYQPDPTDTSAILAFAKEYTAVEPSGSVDLYTKFKVNSAIYGFNNDWGVPGYSCNSGNCTWNDFSTLAVCSRCKDLTPQLSRNCTKDPNFTTTIAGATGPPCDYKLPNGMNLGPDGTTLMRINMTNKPLFFTNYSHPLAVMQTISSFVDTYIDSSTKVYASECVLIPCVQVLRSSIGPYQYDRLQNADPNADEDLPSSYGDQFFLELNIATYEESKMVGDGLSHTPPVPDPNTGIFISPPKNESRGLDDTPFRIGTDSVNAIKSYLTEIFQGTAVNQDGNFGYENEKDGHSGDATNAIQSLHDQSAIQNTCQIVPSMNSQSSIECTMYSVAQALTVAMRDEKFNKMLQADPNDPATLPTDPNNPGALTLPTATTRDTSSTVAGVTVNPFTVISVTWYWITLPIVVWVLSCIMLLGTAWKTRKSGIRTWRTSPLALVFLGLGAEEAEKAKSHDMSVKGLAKKAAELKVRLRVTNEEALLEKA